MTHLAQQTAPDGDTTGASIHQSLSFHRINMVCAGIHFTGQQTRISCCVDLEHQDRARELADGKGDLVCLVSIYPHHASSVVLGVFLGILGQHSIPCHHLVSSHAVISAVIGLADRDRTVALLEKAFSLPPSHTPFRQEIDMDLTNFLKKYPETRASYVEEKIKTYGIRLEKGLDLFRRRCPASGLADIGNTLAAMPDARFHLVSATPVSDGYEFFAAMDPGQAGQDRCGAVDLLSFHGPHFGDRYRILGTALECLATESIPVSVVGCTGASVTLLLPAGQGAAGRQALAKGFDAP